MPEIETVHIQSGRLLNYLQSEDASFLKEIEKAANVKITSRQEWLKIEGAKKSRSLVKALIEHLDQAALFGLRIRSHEVRYGLEALKKGDTEHLTRLWSTQLLISSRKPPIVPKTGLQLHYLDTIAHHPLVFGIGPAGTGKTFLAMAMALTALKKKEVEKIILTRPAVEAGETLGFLPGDLQQKILPYLRPLYDALNEMLEPDEAQRLLEKGVIEVAPLAYMRGRTLHHAFIILDEGQNTTPEQMFMLLTRMGPESKCVITGDPSQVDLPGAKKSGLNEALEALANVREIAIVRFSEKDVMRHELVAKITAAYETYRKQTEQSKYPGSKSASKPISQKLTSKTVSNSASKRNSNIN